MTSPEPSPLTAEEQALSERLARLGPRAEPSPALDARVLAAAHVAAHAPASRPVPAPRRWPAMLGLAASLVLAVGLAWRMRPRTEPPPAPRRDDVAAFRMVAAPAPSAAASVPAAAGPPETQPQESNAEMAGARQAALPEAKPSAPAAERLLPAGPLAPAPSAKAVVAAPAPVEMPPPPPAPAVLRDVEPQARAAVAAAPPAASATEAADTNAEADTQANEAGQADASRGTREGDEPADEVPPATLDSPSVRDAWLQRIHGLVDAGDIAGARASLREFERRYPDYPLPEDLRALAR